MVEGTGQNISPLGKRQKRVTDNTEGPGALGSGLPVRLTLSCLVPPLECFKLNEESGDGTVVDSVVTQNLGTDSHERRDRRDGRRPSPNCA